MKKFFYFFAVAAMALGLASCNKNGDDTLTWDVTYEAGDSAIVAMITPSDLTAEWRACYYQGTVPADSLQVLCQRDYQKNRKDNVFSGVKKLSVSGLTPNTVYTLVVYEKKASLKNYNCKAVEIKTGDQSLPDIDIAATADALYFLPKESKNIQYIFCDWDNTSDDAELAAYTAVEWKAYCQNYFNYVQPHIVASPDSINYYCVYNNAGKGFYFEMNANNGFTKGKNYVAYAVGIDNSNWKMNTEVGLLAFTCGTPANVNAPARNIEEEAQDIRYIIDPDRELHHKMFSFNLVRVQLSER